MKPENLPSHLLKKIFRAGVYGTLCSIGLGLTAFVLWSLFCVGSAVFRVLSGTA